MKQKLLSEKLRDLRDAMPRHWSLCFLVSPCYLQDAMPCQWSSSDLPRVLRIWESVFYSQAFFTLHSFLLVLRFLRNIAPARLFAWFTAIHKKFICGRFYLRFTAGRLRNEEFATYRNWTLFAIGEHARGLMLYPFGHWAMQFEVNQSSNVCCNLCFRSFQL